MDYVGCIRSGGKRPHRYSSDILTLHVPYFLQPDSDTLHNIGKQRHELAR